MVPVPQQTLPEAQSSAPSHCQSVDPPTGHVTPADAQVDSEDALSGGSQQCSPALQVTSSLSEALLNGQ